MLAALWKMTDANQKEMLAGLFLFKFNTKESKAGLERLGYDTFQDAYKGLAELVGGNPLSVRNYCDEFAPVFRASVSSEVAATGGYSDASFRIPLSSYQMGRGY